MDDPGHEGPPVPGSHDVSQEGWSPDREDAYLAWRRRKHVADTAANRRRFLEGLAHDAR